MNTVVIDQKKGIGALLHSWHIGKGLWGTIFLRQIQLGLIVMVISWVLTFIAGILIGFGSDPYSLGGVNIIGTTIVTFVWTCVIYPITTSYTYLLYKNAKEGKTEAPAEWIEKKKKQVIGLGILGVVVIVAAISLGIFMALKFGMTDRNMPNLNTYNLPANALDFIRR
jgi:hypothetical protein